VEEKLSQEEGILAVRDESMVIEGDRNKKGIREEDEVTAGAATEDSKAPDQEVEQQETKSLAERLMYPAKEQEQEVRG